MPSLDVVVAQHDCFVVCRPRTLVVTEPGEKLGSGSEGSMPGHGEAREGVESGCWAVRFATFLSPSTKRMTMGCHDRGGRQRPPDGVSR